MSNYRAGQAVRITDTDIVAVIWSEAPGVACYWAHVEGRVVKIRVRMEKGYPKPTVRVVDEVKAS